MVIFKHCGGLQNAMQHWEKNLRYPKWNIQFVRLYAFQESLCSMNDHLHILLTFGPSYILSIRAALFWKKKFTFHSVFSVLTQKNLPKSIINQMDASGMLLHGCHMMSTLSSHFSNSKHKEHLKSSISWISEFSKFVWPHFSTWKTLTKAEKSSNNSISWKPLLQLQILIIKSTAHLTHLQSWTLDFISKINKTKASFTGSSIFHKLLKG